MAKHEYALWMRKVPTALVGGKWVKETRSHQVRVMARAEGYAMVRRKGCAPFCVPEKELGQKVVLRAGNRWALALALAYPACMFGMACFLIYKQAHGLGLFLLVVALLAGLASIKIDSLKSRASTNLEDVPHG